MARSPDPLPSVSHHPQRLLTQTPSAYVRTIPRLHTTGMSNEGQQEVNAPVGPVLQPAFYMVKYDSSEPLPTVSTFRRSSDSEPDDAEETETDSEEEAEPDGEEGTETSKGESAEYSVSGTSQMEEEDANIPKYMVFPVPSGDTHAAAYLERYRQEHEDCPADAAIYAAYGKKEYDEWVKCKGEGTG